MQNNSTHIVGGDIHSYTSKVQKCTWECQSPNPAQCLPLYVLNFIPCTLQQN